MCQYLNLLYMLYNNVYSQSENQPKIVHHSFRNNFVHIRIILFAKRLNNLRLLIHIISNILLLSELILINLFVNTRANAV